MPTKFLGYINIEVIEQSFGENHKIFQMLTIFSKYSNHAIGHTLQHKKYTAMLCS